MDLDLGPLLRRRRHRQPALPRSRREPRRARGDHRHGCAAGASCTRSGYRHPAVLANAMATLDQIADGRITLGLGGGWMAAEYDAYGIPFPPAGVRLRQVDEAIQCVRGPAHPGAHQLRRRVLHPHRRAVRAEAGAGRGCRSGSAAAARRSRCASRPQHADGWNVPFIAPETTRTRSTCSHAALRRPSAATRPRSSRPVNVGIAMRDGRPRGPVRQRWPNYVGPGVLQGSVAGDRRPRRRVPRRRRRVGDPRDARAVRRRRPRPLRRRGPPPPRDVVSDHELRLDPLTGEWVAIVGDRQARPNLPGRRRVPVLRRRARGAGAVHGARVREPLAAVRARRAGRPRPTPPTRRHRSPPARRAARPRSCSTRPSTTARSRRIGVDGVRAVVDLWAERTAALLARPEIEYVLVFENRGAEVGATISHPHGQIYAFPSRPARSRAARPRSPPRHGCPLCALVPAEVEAGDPRRARRRRVGRARSVRGRRIRTRRLLAPRHHVADLAGARRRRVATGSRPRSSTSSVATTASTTEPLPYLMWIHPGVHLHVHFAPLHRAPGVLRYVASAEVGSGTLSNPVAPEAAAAAAPRRVTR